MTRRSLKVRRQSRPGYPRHLDKPKQQSGIRRPEQLSSTLATNINDSATPMQPVKLQSNMVITYAIIRAKSDNSGSSDQSDHRPHARLYNHISTICMGTSKHQNFDSELDRISFYEAVPYVHSYTDATNTRNSITHATNPPQRHITILTDKVGLSQ